MKYTLSQLENPEKSGGYAKMTVNWDKKHGNIEKTKKTLVSCGKM